MPDEILPDDAPDDAALESYVARLDAFAQTLAPREQKTLETMILMAMDPIERMRYRRDPDLLSDREEAYLRALGEERRA